MTSINAITAAAHRDDLRRAASEWQLGKRGVRRERADRPASTVELRFAAPDDADRARELAELDDAAPLEGQVLLALIDNQAVAALSLADGRVTANPFVPTQDAVALLRLRARHLAGARARRRWRTWLRPRIAV